MHQLGALDHCRTDKPFDESECLARLDGNVPLLQELVSFFTEDAPHWLKEMRQSIEHGDTQALAYAAHGLAGLVANFSAWSAFALAREVESKARTGHLAMATETYAKLEKTINDLLPVLIKLAHASD
jgi:HPt (histidine-containing phosphotransfer) domain-containing protein